MVPTSKYEKCTKTIKRKFELYFHFAMALNNPQAWRDCKFTLQMVDGSACCDFCGQVPPECIRHVWQGVFSRILACECCFYAHFCWTGVLGSTRCYGIREDISDDEVMQIARLYGWKPNLTKSARKQ